MKLLYDRYNLVYCYYNKKSLAIFSESNNNYVCVLSLTGIILGTLYVGGMLMAREELRPGDLMSFMVASQTIQRFVLCHFQIFIWNEKLKL